jgi:hypothetical protein
MTIRDKVATSDIIFDESIYPREKIDHKRVSIFAENLRENVKFDPIVVQIHPKKKTNTGSWMACIDGMPIKKLV